MPRRWASCSNGWGRARRSPTPVLTPSARWCPPRAWRTHPLIDTAPALRVRHALGQSLPDWFKLRHGRIGAVPDGVAFPDSGEQVRALLDHARAHGIVIIAHGGGTSVAGHLTVPDDGRPVLSLSLQRLCALQGLDREAQLATFGAAYPWPRPGSPAARARLHPGPLSAIVRVFHPGRLDRHALVGPAVAALWPHRAAVCRRRGGNAGRHAGLADLSRLGGRHRPARNGAGLGRAHRHHHRGDRARRCRCRRAKRSTPCSLPTLRRRWPPCAHWRKRACL